MSSYWPDFLSGANLQPPLTLCPPPPPPAPHLWCFRAFGGPSTTWKMSAWCRWRSSEPRDWWRRTSQVGRRPKRPNGRAWTSAEVMLIMLNFFLFSICLFVCSCHKIIRREYSVILAIVLQLLLTAHSALQSTGKAFEEHRSSTQFLILNKSSGRIYLLLTSAVRLRPRPELRLSQRVLGGSWSPLGAGRRVCLRTFRKHAARSFE